jgi:transcriptional regulator with XRE-family HTH domain
MAGIGKPPYRAGKSRREKLKNSPDRIKQIIGANIQELRQAGGLTQLEFAGFLGCSRASISQIESGKTLATVDFLYKAADVLHCAVSDIIPENTEQRALKKHLNALRDEAFAYAEKQGFHKRSMNLGEHLMLAVSELGEALEADREGKWAPKDLAGENEHGKTVTTKLSDIMPESLSPDTYTAEIRGTVEEEIADAIIRICDIAGVYGIDLDWHVAAKMAYNHALYARQKIWVKKQRRSEL